MSQKEISPIKPEHQQIIDKHLLPGEVLHGAAECHGVPTLFAAITDLRLLVSTKQKTILSIPWNRITSVSYDPGGLMGSDMVRAYLAEEKKIELGFANQERVLAMYQMLIAAFLGQPIPGAR